LRLTVGAISPVVLFRDATKRTRGLDIKYTSLRHDFIGNKAPR